MQTIRFRSEFSRRLPNPGLPNSDRHILLIRVEDLPPGIAKDANPREQRTDRSVWKEIKTHLLGEQGTPGTFHLKNKGITILATNVVKRADDELEVTIEPGQGIVDGGHTYDLIVQCQEEIRERLSDDLQPQFVKVEILTGIEAGLVTEIAGGLNTAIQVQQMSLENLKGKFDWIKETLRGTPYADEIAYRENENCEHDVRDLVALLDVFNIAAFPNDGDEYPVRSYSQKAEVLSAYVDPRKHEQYLLLKPILRDILTLHDVISEEARELHNKSGGKGGKLSFMEARKKGEFTFTFTGGSSKHRLAKAALLPMLGAFRWMVVIQPETGLAGWRGSFEDVLRLWRKVGAELMRATQTTNDEYGRKAHAVGRSRNHWATLHGIVVKQHLMGRAVDPVG